MAQALGCFCTEPALPRGNAHSPEQNCSSKHQLVPQASAEQGITGKTHLGVADPIPPQAMCALRLCTFMPVCYEMLPDRQFLWLGWPLQKTIPYRKLIHSLVTVHIKNVLLVD